MKALRVFLLFLFMGLIVFGLTKYYKEHPEVHIQGLKKNMVTKQLQQKDLKTSEKSFQVTSLHPDFSTGKLSLEATKQLLSQGVHGGGEGNITWIHYCDYDLEYCQKSYSSGMVYVYGSMIPEMRYIYKPFPATNDKMNRLAHQAVLCATHYGTPKQALSYYNALYGDKRIRKSKDSLISFANQLGIKNMEQCFEQKQYNAILEKEVQFAKKFFNIHALPTNLLINTNTGERVLIPGYYTKEELRGATEYIKKT